MFDKRQYLVNTVVNYVVYFTNIVVALILSPFVVHTLGDRFYGTWTIIVAFTGYYGYLDLGIRQGVSQYVSRYLTSRDYRKFNITVNAAMIMLCTIGTAIIAASALFSLFFGDFLIKGVTADASLRLSFFILGFGVAVRFPFLLFQSVVNGMQRYDVSGSVVFITKLLYAVAVYQVLARGYGIYGLAVVTTLSQLLEGVLTMIAAKRLVPQLRLAPARPDREAVKEVMGYGIYNFVTGLANQTILFIGPLVIARKLGPELVTYYSIGANLIPYYASMIGILSIPLLQVVIAQDVKQETEDLKLLYLQGTRYVNLLVTYVAFGLIILGEPFLGRWMGHRYIDNGVCSSATVMSILALSQMIDLSQTIGRQVLFGVRKHQFLAVISTCGALFTLLITIYMVDWFSAVGAALALLIKAVVLNGILMPLYMCRLLKVTLVEYLKSCIASNLVLFLVMTALVRQLTAGRIEEDWLQIAAALAAISVAYLTPGALIIFGKDAVGRALLKLRPKVSF